MLIALLQFFTKEYNKEATNDFKQLARWTALAGSSFVLSVEHFKLV